MVAVVRLPNSRYPSPAPTDTAIMIHPLYVMNMSLHMHQLCSTTTASQQVTATTEGRGKDSHDHERIKVLEPVQHRLDDVGAPRHLALVLAWSEEEGGSLSNSLGVVIVAVEDAASSS